MVGREEDGEGVLLGRRRRGFFLVEGAALKREGGKGAYVVAWWVGGGPSLARVWMGVDRWMDR